MSRPTWQDLAACRRSNLDFTAEQTDIINRVEVTDIREACAHICAGCPVRTQCGAQAEAERLAPATPGDILIRPFGVLGGLFYDGTAAPPRPPRYAAPTTTATLTDELRQHVLDLVHAGHSDNDIGDLTGLAVDRCRRIRLAAGIRRSKARHSRPKYGPIEHGSANGSRAHYRRGETPCEPCREAAAQDRRDRRARDVA